MKITRKNKPTKNKQRIQRATEIENPKKEKEILLRPDINANIAPKRKMYMFFLLIVLLLYSVFLSMRYNVLTDKIVLAIILSIFVFISTAIYLYSDRITTKDPVAAATSYKHEFLTIAAATVVSSLSSIGFFVPYYMPVLVIFCILTVTNEMYTSLAYSLYFVAITLYFAGTNSLIITMYIIRIIAAAALIIYLQRADLRKKYILYVHTICFMTQLAIITIFNYFEENKISVSRLILGMLVLIAELLITYIINRYIKVSYEEIKDETYIIYIDEGYSLVKDIKRYFPNEYYHAKKVADLAEICARAVGANFMCAKMAGFYYRLGRMEGDGDDMHVAIDVANSNCFPADVIAILYEYHGVNRAPSSKESAIVHMVDNIVTKIELIAKEEKFDSKWNQNMLIYQTLNELSNSGIYDASTISMNEFLKIRNILADKDLVL